VIGDSKARGKIHSTTKNDKQPKHGRSHLIITPDADKGSGGDKQQHRVAKQMGRGKIRPGTDAHDKQSPKAQRSRKIAAWCSGKSENYC
jgi:hypothetical protein